MLKSITVVQSMNCLGTGQPRRNKLNPNDCPMAPSAAMLFALAEPHRVSCGLQAKRKRLPAPLPQHAEASVLDTFGASRIQLFSTGTARWIGHDRY